MKETVLKYKNNYPILISIAIAGIFLLVLLGTGQIITNIIDVQGFGEYALQLIVEIIGVVLAVSLIFLLQCTDIFKLQKYGVFKGLFVGLFFVIQSFIVIVFQISSIEQIHFNSPFIIVIFTVTMLLIGLTEEFIFRDIISNIIFCKYGKDTAGVWFSVLVSSFIFGLVHIGNAIVLGNLTTIFMQVLNAFILGMALTAIYYRTKNIWTVVLLHAFLDFSALFSSGIFGIGSMGEMITSFSIKNLIGSAIYLGLTLFLLRPSKIKEIRSSNETSTMQNKKRLWMASTLFSIVCIATVVMLLPTNQTIKTKEVFCSFSGIFPDYSTPSFQIDENANCIVNISSENNCNRVVDLILTDNYDQILMERISNEDIFGEEYIYFECGETYFLKIIYIDSIVELDEHIKNYGYSFNDKEINSFRNSINNIESEEWNGAKITLKVTNQR